LQDPEPLAPCERPTVTSQPPSPQSRLRPRPSVTFPLLRFQLGPLPRTLLRRTATLIWFASLAVLLLLAIFPRTGAYRTLTFFSGSMRPAFAPGDLVVARPTSAE